MRETAVTLSRNAGHAPAKSPVTMARNTHMERGGGGAIDLVMHLYTIKFKAATTLLKERGV